MPDEAGKNEKRTPPPPTTTGNGALIFYSIPYCTGLSHHNIRLFCWQKRIFFCWWMMGRQKWIKKKRHQRSMDNLIETWKAAASLQVATSSLSFISWTGLAITIYRSYRRSDQYVSSIHTQRQRTAYKRLIFAISVSDILQSFGLLIGPFTVYCTVIGVTSHLGNRQWSFMCFWRSSLHIWVDMGAHVLCCLIYFIIWCKLHRGMSDAAFHVKVERYMHIFIILFMVSINLFALATTMQVKSKCRM